MNGRKIGRLHFHFSGHGTRNQDTGKLKEAKVGDFCLIGSGTSAKFIPGQNVKQELWKWNTEKLTITFDCCRGDDKLGEDCSTENTSRGFWGIFREDDMSRGAGPTVDDNQQRCKVSNIDKNVHYLCYTKPSHSS